MKRCSLLFALLGGLVGGLLFSQLYDRYLCPEACFYSRAADASDAWAAQLRQSDAPCIIWAGGSELRAGIDPKQLADGYGIRSVNAAGQAGFGMPANLSLALPYLKEGDTLIFSCLGLDEIYPSGAKFAWQRAGLSLFDSGLVPSNAETLRKIFCGNSGEFSMHLSKRMVHPLQAPYKYDNIAEIHPSGWMEIHSDELKGTAPSTVGRLDGATLPRLSEGYVRNIKTLKAYCEARGVKLACMMPVFYTRTEDRPLKAWLVLQHLELGIPVLHDDRLGCEENVNYFSDFGGHLNAAGVAVQTRILGRALKENDWWSRAEIVSYLRLRGWDENGRWVYSRRSLW